MCAYIFDCVSMKCVNIAAYAEPPPPPSCPSDTCCEEWETESLLLKSSTHKVPDEVYAIEEYHGYTPTSPSSAYSMLVHL